MSKYIKLEDAIEAYNQAVTLLVESEMEEFNLGDFTECSFNTTQIKLIARMIESLPTIEVSEDCISREYLKSFAYINKGDFNSVETIREWIDNAPSVTTEQSSIVDIVTCEECKRCKKGLVIERRADGQETIVNLCNRTKPPTMVSLDFYCKDGERIEE